MTLKGIALWIVGAVALITAFLAGPLRAYSSPVLHVPAGNASATMQPGWCYWLEGTELMAAHECSR